MLTARVKQENMRKWLVLIFVLTSLDQVSKRLAEHTLEFARPEPVIPLFNFMLVYNEGAAFSLLSQAGGWQRWFFVVLTLAVSIYIFNWLRRLGDHEILLGSSLSLILSGALGNLIDRVLFGKVTDFIDFYYSSAGECLYLFFLLPDNTCHWPTFNIADMLISTGAGLLLLQTLRAGSSIETHPH